MTARPADRDSCPDDGNAATHSRPNPGPSPHASSPLLSGADPEVDPEIRAERAFLDRAQQALREMYAEVRATETHESSIEDRDEVWHNLMYHRARSQRARALVDLPDVPLFFGRLDYEPGSVPDGGVGAPAEGSTAGDTASAAGTVDADAVANVHANVHADVTDRDSHVERIYIGRRHVRDGDGRPLVIDWRASLSAPFYRASREDPQRVRRRRRYGFSDSAELTAYEDEPLGAGAGADDPTGAAGSALLTAEIERPRSGPMRDIVATIQPDQDDLVRAPLHPTLCIQGAPGTGKTAVGLHRIAYLLYTEPRRLGRGNGVTVLGPNRSFLAYIHRVLPALGEVDVSQTTVNELIQRVPIRREDEPDAARIKGDARMAEVLRRDLWARPQPLSDTLVVPRGSRRWRVHPEQLGEIVTDLVERGGSYRAGRDLLSKRVAAVLIRQIEAAGDAFSEKIVSELRRSQEMTSAVRAMWPMVQPVKLVLDLLTDPDRLARAAEGILTSAEQNAVLLPGRPRGPKSARWSAADLALIDEAAALIDRPATLSHVVVDEAQDLSPMQARAIGRRCPNGSLTVLGDLAQGTSPSAVRDWSTLLVHFDQADAELAVLDRGFRVPAEIIAYAARLLPQIAPGLPAPSAVRRDPGALHISPVSSSARDDAVIAACRDHLDHAGTVAVIASDRDLPELHARVREAGLEAASLADNEDAMTTSRLVTVPARLAKGLEFDAVIVVEPAHIVAAEPRGLQRLYVVLTRAVSALHVIHAEQLPRVLED